MELQNMIEVLASNKKVQVLYGLEAYTLPLMLRIEQRPKVVRQIINQEKVAEFHSLTGKLVKDIITKRVEFGISFKNLITFGDTVRDIEKSNLAMLKETRMLARGLKFDLMLAVFNDIVTITKLDPMDCFGYAVQDQVLAQSFECMFDALWEQGTVV